jgi:hypothetical protein
MEVVITFLKNMWTPAQQYDTASGAPTFHSHSNKISNEEPNN